MATSGIKPDAEAVDYVNRFKKGEFRALIFNICGDKIKCTEQFPALEKDAQPEDGDDVLHTIHLDDSTENGYYLIKARLCHQQSTGLTNTDFPIMVRYISDSKCKLKNKMQYSTSWEAIKKIATGDRGPKIIITANDLTEINIGVVFNEVLKNHYSDHKQVVSLEGMTPDKIKSTCGCGK